MWRFRCLETNRQYCRLFSFNSELTAMSATPRVTFLLSVRNVQATVGATIESVLAQTMADLELLILDDASTDETVRVINAYRDRRIRLVTNPTQLNHSRTANLGLSLANSEYVARIDGDDLCLPHRAAVQADYLDRHPDIAVLGSAFETFSDDPAEKAGEVIAPPLDSATIAVTLMFRNAIAQPAVMLRKSKLAEKGIGYDPLCLRAEDYELWGRCAVHGLVMVNLSDVLVRYRLHARQGVRLHAAACEATGVAVRKMLIAHLGLATDAANMAIHEAIAADQFVPEASFISDAAGWLTTLAQANQRRRLFDHSALMRFLTGRYVTLSRFARSHQLLLPDLAASPFAEYLYPGVLV
jgi:glycosyltransferase involved in cell wall biosynthesis